MAWRESESEGACPRISFSFNLSATDRTRSEKPKREEPISPKYAKEFEFCRVNNCRKTLSYADELFVDGKILSPGRSFESQPGNMTRHLSLEKSDRFPSFPHSKTESAGRKRSQKPASRWTNYYLCVLPFSRHKSNRKEFKSATFRSQSAEGLQRKCNKSVTEVDSFSKAMTNANRSHSCARNEKLIESSSPKSLKTNIFPNISGVVMKVSPVLNVSPALFGLRTSSKKESRNSLHFPPATYMDM